MFVETYEEAIEWMNTQKTTIHRIGLDKIKLALERVGNPHLGLNTIHIGGTNGKGSVTAYLKHLFLKHGFSVGTFTSPHIMKFNERITFNGVEIEDKTVIDLVNQLIALNQFMEQTIYGRLVFFELYTVMMFLYFNQVQPDICLIEVGLGGKLDCTNVIESKDIIITTIGMDHVERLGHTFEEIAIQKAGIIHGKADVFIGHLPNEAVYAVKQRCEEENASIYQLSEVGKYEIKNQSIDGTHFVFNNSDEIFIQMIGEHQVHNAALALSFFKHWMEKYHYQVDKQLMIVALKETQWIGRMEKINKQPLIFIDGAHNEAGLLALKKTIEVDFKEKSVKMIYTGLKTKNQLTHLEIIKTMPLTKLVLTTFKEHPQAMSYSDFSKIINFNSQHGIEISFNKDWKTELLASNDEVIIVTGSLYFIANVRKYFF